MGIKFIAWADFAQSMRLTIAELGGNPSLCLSPSILVRDGPQAISSLSIPALRLLDAKSGMAGHKRGGLEWTGRERRDHKID